MDNSLSLLVAIKFCQALICLPFLVSAAEKTANFPAAVAEVAALGLPAPRATGAAVIALQAGAPAMILLDWFAWAAALALAGFTLLATFLAHRFWALPADRRASARTVFVEHLSIFGGLLLVAAADLAPLSAARTVP